MLLITGHCVQFAFLQWDAGNVITELDRGNAALMQYFYHRILVASWAFLPTIAQVSPSLDPGHVGSSIHLLIHSAGNGELIQAVTDIVPGVCDPTVNKTKISGLLRLAW